jgi:hypothetical protein
VKLVSAIFRRSSGFAPTWLGWPCTQLTCAPAPDGFSFKLICKCDQSSLYFNVTGHESEPAALLDFAA